MSIVVSFNGPYEVETVQHNGPYYEVNNGGCLYIKKSIADYATPEAIYAKGIWRTVSEV